MTKKRGQVTIFIIIGILIIGLVVLGITLYPQIKSTITGESKTPALFIQTCMEGVLKESAALVSLQGGSINPKFFVLHDSQKIEYLCYTNENYKTCVVQQPMLKSHIEKEIKEDIKDEAENCFDSLKESYQKQGYEANLKSGAMNVELLPKRVVANFNYTLTLTKANTERYESFVAVLNNNLYELSTIANSIVNWETTYGNAEISSYMTYYPDLKVEVTSKADDTKVYIITDRNTKNKFQFAVRGGVLSAGH